MHFFLMKDEEGKKLFKNPSFQNPPPNLPHQNILKPFLFPFPISIHMPKHLGGAGWDKNCILSYMGGGGYTN